MKNLAYDRAPRLLVARRVPLAAEDMRSSMFIDGKPGETLSQLRIVVPRKDRMEAPKARACDCRVAQICDDSVQIDVRNGY